MERVLIAVLVVAIAAVIAYVVDRRRPAPPTQPRWSVPAQLDRTDFDAPHTPWLVAVFTSSTCNSCHGTLAKATLLTSHDVAVQEVEVSARPDLHRRYAIDAVPLTVIAGPDGVVAATFVGEPTATDLWAAVAEARNPGSTPEPELGRAQADGGSGPAV